MTVILSHFGREFGQLTKSAASSFKIAAPVRSKAGLSDTARDLSFDTAGRSGFPGNGSRKPRCAEEVREERE
jgi:hypothetical protein